MPTILVDSYSETNQDFDFSFSGLDPGFGLDQSFAGKNCELDSIKLYAKKEGSPTGSVFIYLRSHSGGYGEANSQAGSILATSDSFDITSMSTSFALHTFTFSGNDRYQLQDGVHYFFVVGFGGGDASNRPTVGYDSTSPTHSGAMGFINDDGSNFVFSDEGETIYDMCFYVYGTNGRIKTYDGSSFVARPVKYWDGSQWAEKPLKYWDGTAWVTTPY